MKLTKNDIIGRRLIRIFQKYEVVDGWIHMAFNYFEMETGICFMFPFNHKGIESVDIPPEAKELPLGDLKALGSTIKALYRQNESADLYESDDCLMYLDSGLWVSQLTSAPEGAHGMVGLEIEPDPPENMSDMIDYWSESWA